MINLDVSNTGDYVSLEVEGMNSKFDTGLLDASEALDVSIKLIHAAMELLPREYSDEENDLAKVCIHLGE